jgi:selenocysteine lyase/cysteine desulfurase
MLSVEGLGGFYISRDALGKVYPVTVGWDSVVDAWDFMNYDFTFRPDARRFEEGSFNTMSIHALGAALDLLLEVGVETIESRILLLCDYLVEGLQQRGVKILSSIVPEERSGIITFALGANLTELATYMAENDVSLTVRDGMVRLSPHFYNSEAEADRFLDLLDNFLKS